MLTALKKLGAGRTVPRSGPFSFTRQALPLYTPTRKSFAFKQEPDQYENEQAKPALDFNEEVNRLLTEKITDIINPEELKRKVEEIYLQTHMTPEEVKQAQLKELEALAGPNFKNMVNTKYTIAIDAFKDRSIKRVFPFSFQSSLDDYKFKDGIDYHILDRTDEAKALNRLSVVELGNSHMQSQLKYVLKEGEHFSKFEGEYYAEDYLKDKPENYVAVFNLPADSTQRDLYKVFSKHGAIRNFNLRKTFFGLPAILEIIYATKEEALAAKAAQNNKKYKGKMLNVKTIEDRAYEDPVNRTVVVCGLNPNMSVQAILEQLSHFGSIMHFELPIQQRIRALPSREELERYIKTSNVSESGKYKINIQTRKYEMVDGELTCKLVNEDNVLESNDKKPYFYEEKIADKEHDQLMGEIEATEIREEEHYAKKFFSDPFEKTFEAVDLSQFRVNHSSVNNKDLLEKKDEPSLQYYLQTVEEIKAKTTKESELTYDQKVEVNNLVQEPFSLNKGYIFATFSHTDEAKKAMINIPLYPLFNGTQVTLKKDDGHLDWDAEFFTKTYAEIRESSYQIGEKIVDNQHKLQEKQDFQATIDEYKSNTFGDEYEKHILENPVKKREFEIKRSPEEWMEHFKEEEEDNQVKIREELESIYERRANAQFSKKDAFEKKFESEEEEEYQPGRAFTHMLADRDVQNFEKILKDKKIKRQQQLNVDPNTVEKDAIEELLRKAMTGEDVSEESPLLDRFRKQIEKEDPLERFMRTIDEHEVVEDIIARKETREETNLLSRTEGEKFEEVEDLVDKEGEEEENMYYNPFQPINYKKPSKLDVPTSSDDLAARDKYNQKKEKFVENVRKHVEGTFSKQEIQEEIEKTREELKDHIRPRPYFKETDKEGNTYITKEDEARFEEERKPEDPVERAIYEKKVERLNQIKELTWYKELEKTAAATDPIVNQMLSKGFPVEAFKFNPTEDCETIEEFIDKMKAANPKYNFEKSLDEDGNEIVIKLIRDSTYATEVNINTEEEFENFVADLQEYLIENGISEEELGLTEFQGTNQEYMDEVQKRQTSSMSALDEKILGLLLKRYSRETVEDILTGKSLSPENIEQTLRKMQMQAELKAKQDESKALTRDDFVKYSSQVFHVRENNGKFKKSKYDTI